MGDRVLLLTPSRGLGGGIERYIGTVEAAFAREGVDHVRIDQSRPGVAAYRDLTRRAVADIRASGRRTRLVVAHPRLLPVGMLVARLADVSGISLLCYGADVWLSPRDPRWRAERALLRTAAIRVVAISSFTAGTLFHGKAATILPAGVDQQWFDTLVAASATAPPARDGIDLVTVFRLEDWRDKGLPEIL